MGVVGYPHRYDRTEFLLNKEAITFQKRIQIDTLPRARVRVPCAFGRLHQAAEVNRLRRLSYDQRPPVLVGNDPAYQGQALRTVSIQYPALLNIEQS